MEGWGLCAAESAKPGCKRRPSPPPAPWHPWLQWFLEPESMRLPPIVLPEGLTPQGRQIMQTLAVSGGWCRECAPCLHALLLLGCLLGA